MSVATTKTKPTPKPAISEARRLASRINGARSRGPRTLDGKAQSRLNAIKHGMTGGGIALPETMAEVVDRYRDDLTRQYPPLDAEDRRLIEQAALAAARIDQVGNVEHAQRIAEADRAETGWEIDCAAAAEALADRLSRRPARIAAELKTSRHGCEWLIKRWKGLTEVLEGQRVWDDAQRGLALNLLGLPPELRGEHPFANPETPAEDLADLVRQEIKALRRLLRDALYRRDALQRELAVQGLAYDIGPTNRRLLSYERASQRRYDRCIQELQRRRGKTSAQAPAPKAPAWRVELKPVQGPIPELEPKPKPNSEDITPTPSEPISPSLAPSRLWLNNAANAADSARSNFPVEIPQPTGARRITSTPVAPAGNRQARRAALAISRKRTQAAGCSDS